LQPAFCALPAVRAEVVGGEAVATQGEFEGFQCARQTIESHDGMTQRAMRVFGNAD
jgi:hypothetical protein